MTTVVSSPVQLDFYHYLPPYRSLLSPNNRYDYKTHSLIPFNTENDGVNISTYMNLNIKKNLTKNKIKMKYKSLLSDVSRKKSLLTTKINPILNNSINRSINEYEVKPELFERFEKEDPITPLCLTTLPSEIIFEIFSYLSFDDYLNNILVNKQLYQLTKPLLYENLSFISTYRFAEFITLLRINPSLGYYVKSLDLSNVQPCNYGVDESVEDVNTTNTENKIMAGWRDWKFKSNPLYGHTVQLTKCQTHSGPSSARSVVSSSKSTMSLSSAKLKFSKLKVNFKKRKLSHSAPSVARVQPGMETLNLNHHQSPYHPSINKFLINYSNSKDIPIGYIIHFLRLCPNLLELNLGNVSLSNDYEIKDIFKYKNYDIRLNYNSNGIAIVDKLMNSPDLNQNYQAGSTRRFALNPFKGFDDNFSIRSSNTNLSSSNITINTITNKKFPKYQSLLSPIPATSTNTYHHYNDKVFLSDLNLKSINPKNLIKISETSILHEIEKLKNLQKLNLSSLIWLSLPRVQKFLRNFSYDNNWIQMNNFQLNFKDSGMNKNLNWAVLIEDVDTINKILKNDLISDYEEFILNDRISRGRIGENYL